MIVLRNPDTGEQVAVEDATGYPDWVVLEERTDAPPEHAEWVDGQGFVVNDAAKAATEEAARLATLSRAEFMAEVDLKLTAHALELASLQQELAKRDVQIAELAQAGAVALTPISDIAIEPPSIL